MQYYIWTELVVGGMCSMPLLTVVSSRDQLLEMQQAKRRVNHLFPKL